MFIKSNLKMAEVIAECLYLSSFINQKNPRGSKMNFRIIEVKKNRRIIISITPVLIMDRLLLFVFQVIKYIFY